MKKCLKNYAINYTKEDYNQLYRQLIAYNKCKNLFYNLYYNRIDLIHLTYKHELRDSLVSQLKNKTATNDVYGLLSNVPAKLQKCALIESISNLKSNQSNVRTSIRKKTLNNKNFTEKEKYYIRYILTSVNNLHKLNTNKNIDPIEKFKELDQKKLNSYIKRQLKVEKFRKPFATGHSFTLDGYSQIKYYKENKKLFITIPTVIKKKKIKLQLSNSELLLMGDVKVVLVNGKIEFHKADDAKQKKTKNVNIVSVYIDFFDLIHTSSGNTYGENINKILTKYTKLVHEKYEKRENIKKSKSINIFKHNLGKLKQKRHKLKILTEIENYVNKSINDLIKNENAHTIVMQPINNRLVVNNRSNLHNVDIRQIYRLNSWLIKYIKLRLEYKLTLNGINLVLVNSSCTAKACYNCGSLNTVTTNGFFKCKNCMVSTNRIANILSNIWTRYGDKHITQTSSFKEVERLLEQRVLSLSG